MARAQKRHPRKSDRLAILERDGHRCSRCGSANELTVDHIVPFSRGGLSVLANMQTLCWACNQDKADNMPSDTPIEQIKANLLSGACGTHQAKGGE